MKCRGCRQPGLTGVLDLGWHRLPDFTGPGAPYPPQGAPLKLMLCSRCGLLQLSETVPRGLLYHDRYGFVSGVNEAIRADLEDVVKYALDWLGDAQTSRWLDIACNDGTLLSFVPDYMHRTGVDPLAHLAPLARQHADRVISGYFNGGMFRAGEFDVITSVSMFYDLDRPDRFAQNVARILAPDGVWVIQQNYAADMIANNAVDNVCHEHVTYFTGGALLPLLQRAALQIADVQYSAVNGGCIRTLVTHRGGCEPRQSVQSALDWEHAHRLDDPQTWRQWGEDVRAELARTREFLEDARAAGERVLLYGASTRGGTFLQMINAGPDLLPYAVERNPDKVGKVMAATGIPIISEEEMRADPPDALLVSPWFFRDVFVEREAEYLRNGGVMVFPLPRFEVVRR